MNPMLHWLRSRWRTRGEYASTGRRFLWRAGCAVAAPIGMLLAGMFGLYWFLSGPSRAGAREMRIDALADSVSAVASRGQAERLVSLDDYVSAGLFSAEDLAFLNDAGVSFHAVTRSSPDTAVVFRRVRGGTERVYRKDGTRDSYVATPSPDGRFVAVVGPPPSAHGATRQPQSRGLVVRETVGGRTIGSLVLTGSARTTWSPGGRFLAVEAPPADAVRGADTRTFVLLVGPSSVRRLELPAEIAPERLKEPEDRAARLQTSAVRVRQWRGERLEVESEGHGWFGAPGQSGSTSLSLRYRISLDVSEAGVRELERRRITYLKTPRD